VIADKKILALTGLKGSGKDTAYKFIRRTFKQHRFANALKKMLTQMLVQAGYLPYQARMLIDHPVQKEEPLAILGGKTPREAMQTLGTEWGRDIIHPDLWVNVTFSAIENDHRSQICITDLRFPNELQAIKDAGGKVVRITRPGVGATVGAQHPSEAFISSMPADFEIVNDRSKAHLGREMIKALSELGGWVV
jgi:hypothetical protein